MDQTIPNQHLKNAIKDQEIIQKDEKESQNEGNFETYSNGDIKLNKNGRPRKNHQKIHKCFTCGITFTAQAHIMRHISTVHEGNRAYDCSICGKKFQTKQNLTKHVDYNHEGKKPEKTHECYICKKNISSLKDLKNHIKRIHKEDARQVTVTILRDLKNSK